MSTGATEKLKSLQYYKGPFASCSCYKIEFVLQDGVITLALACHTVDIGMYMCSVSRQTSPLKLDIVLLCGT